MSWLLIKGYAEAAWLFAPRHRRADGAAVWMFSAKPVDRLAPFGSDGLLQRGGVDRQLSQALAGCREDSPEL
jgi:hypothetical protein